MAESGFGGNGGQGGIGAGGDGGGGAINNFASGVLKIDLRFGAVKGSKQLKANDVIAGNSVHAGVGGAVGSLADAHAGVGASTSGTAGMTFPGHPDTGGSAATGVGGSLDLIIGGTVVIVNTTITGNSATTADGDVHGTFSS